MVPSADGPPLADDEDTADAVTAPVADLEPVMTGE